MTDDQLYNLVTQDGARLLEHRRKIIHIGTHVLVWNQVGQRERWSLSPSRGIVRLVDGKVPAAHAVYFSTSSLRWVYRASRMDFAAHGRAMGARTL